MTILQDGTMQFDNVYDLTYNLINTIGLTIKNGHLYDQDTNLPISFQGRRLKASVDPNIPCYAGQGEVMFDIINNIRLVTTMLGYVADKATAMGEFGFMSYYTEGDDMTNITFKLNDYSTISTLFYQNKCLKFVHAMFIIYGEKVNLRNFDISESGAPHIPESPIYVLSQEQLNRLAFYKGDIPWTM